MQNIETVKKLIANTPIEGIWQRVGWKEHHGIDIMLSSLHTEKSCGIGEYLDLLPLIDFCKKIPVDIIQLLPLNDSGSDPSPYNALSSCALHPLFLSLYAVPYLEDLPDLQNALSEMRKFNKAQRVDYHSILLHKSYWLRSYVSAVHKKILKLPCFHEFKKNHPWLEKYALFKALKDFFEHSPWKEWPSDLHNLSEEDFAKLYKKFSTEMSFYEIEQYLCFQQMTYVKKYAHAHGILVKGDIPILISPDSADVWAYPTFFTLKDSAGAPPDTYNAEGQNWGFPIFDWEAQEKDHFSWWKMRLKTANELYDIYRIDHIVGFFRIWAIEKGKPSKEGKYIPENPSAWIPQGKKLLSMMVSSSSMLPIGEDLGAVSEEIRECLQSLGICGTKILRWERNWESHDRHYIPPEEYPPLSMTSVSTHDSETVELWWTLHEEEARAYCAYKGWTYEKPLSTEKKAYILWESHHTQSLFHINLLQEYLTLFPELVRKDPEEERMNVPGKILPTNWTYRYIPSVEQIANHGPLLEKMQKIIFSKKSESIYN